MGGGNGGIFYGDNGFAVSLITPLPSTPPIESLIPSLLSFQTATGPSVVAAPSFSRDPTTDCCTIPTSQQLVAYIKDMGNIVKPLAGLLFSPIWRGRPLPPNPPTYKKSLLPIILIFFFTPSAFQPQ